MSAMCMVGAAVMRLYIEGSFHEHHRYSKCAKLHTVQPAGMTTMQHLVVVMSKPALWSRGRGQAVALTKS